MPNIGYLLPPPEDELPELTCCVIFYPNHDAYRRALFGSLDYLGTWTAWEREDGHRAIEASKIWKEATEKTRECFEMGCFDDLITALENIKVVNQYTQNCFCNYITIVNIDYDVTNVVYNQGDPPATYGGGDVVDWDDWKRKVCGNVERYIDILCEQNNQLQQAVELGAIAIGLIGAILAVLSGAGLLLTVGWGAASSIVGGLIALATGSAFSSFCSDIQAVEQDIKEAVICSGDLASVMEGAIDDTAWNVFYQFVNWSQAAAIIRAGEADNQYLDSEAYSEDCDDILCLDIDFIYTWPLNTQGWPSGNNFQWDNGHIKTVCHTDSGEGTWTTHGQRTGNEIRDYFGLASRPNCRYLGFSITFDLDAGAQMEQWIRFKVIGTNGTFDSPEYYSGSHTPGQKYDYELDMGQMIDFRATSVALQVQVKRADNAADGQHIQLDNLYGRS